MVETNWEDLRRLARTLENTLDTKLVAYSRLGSRHSRESNVAGDSMKEDSLFESMSVDIEQILDRLSEINDKMWNLLHPDNSKEKGNGVGRSKAHTASEHTMQRHREILQDYQREYKRTRDNIIALRERERLLKTSNAEMSNSSTALLENDDSNNTSRTTRLLIDDSHHLHSSERLIDEQISLADTIKSALSGQHTSLRLARSRLLVTVSQKMPLIGSLVQRINWRKRRDAIILGTVIGLCTCLVIFFTFR